VARDENSIDPQVFLPRLYAARPVLLAFHKPYGVLSQFTPEPGSRWRTLADFNLPAHVYPLGRLDADSEGLLLLSDEPGLNTQLLDPKNQHRRGILGAGGTRAGSRRAGEIVTGRHRA
jgi:16S rRNA U516 pseudouridylate synthase RsuA-like enzyme